MGFMTQDTIDRSFVPRRQRQVAAEQAAGMESRLASIEAEAQETAALVAAMIKPYLQKGIGFQISVTAAEDPNHKVVQTIPGTIRAPHQDTV